MPSSPPIASPPLASPHPGVPLPARPVFVATPEESRELDRRAIDEIGVPGIVLMENAARETVRHMAELWPDLGAVRLKVTVLGGPGQNGGDGWAVARMLRAMGHAVTAYLVGGPEADPRGDALISFRALEASGVPVARISSDSDPLPDWDAADVLVDAVFGTGIARPLDGQALRVLASVPARPRRLRVAAADLPSGVSGADGRALGPAPEADLTVSYGTYKPGHFAGEGARLAGALRLGDIGLVPRAWEASPPAGRLLDRALAASLLPPRPLCGHKGTFGHAVLAGGSPGRTGALALAAAGAARAGAGLVTAVCPASLAGIVASKLTSPMCLPFPESGEGFLDGTRSDDLAAFVKGLGGRGAALGIGPGLGTGTGAMRLVSGAVWTLPEVPMVLDADALRPESFAVEHLKDRGIPAVMTPHPGEAARLLDTTAEEVEADRLAAARALAALSGSVTVLKGRHTVVMDWDGSRFLVNPGGGPVLAVGGSGDLLTGMATGLLARGMAPFEAAALAVWAHAEAGDLAARDMGPQGISPVEIQRYVPLALSGLGGFVPGPGAWRPGEAV